MTPREREIRERLKAGSERFASDMTYLLAQLTTAREIIEVAKNEFEFIAGKAPGIFTAVKHADAALAKITEMEKEK